MAKRNLMNGAAIPMEPGERDRPVTIQQRTSSTGDSGFPIEPWTTLATPIWMRKLDLRATERFTADQLAVKGDTQWEMGYREDMDPELVDVPAERRLLYQGRTYDITQASQIGRREGIELITIAAVG
jgi:SPP1 family predicted phage head-tail adaptor